MINSTRMKISKYITNALRKFNFANIGLQFYTPVINFIIIG